MPPASDHASSQTETGLPSLVTAIPGPKSLAMAARLKAVESPNATAFAHDFPVVWERAQGANVWDVDGNRYLDLSAAFGVAAVGHAHPKVTEAVRLQSEKLIHGMGDVHPTEIRLRLSERLIGLAPDLRLDSPVRNSIPGQSDGGVVRPLVHRSPAEHGDGGSVAKPGEFPDGGLVRPLVHRSPAEHGEGGSSAERSDGGWKIIYGLSGSDAVEAALKTAALATGKSGVITFEGAYHGMSLGALSVTPWPRFREGFAGMIPRGATCVPFPAMSAAGCGNEAEEGPAQTGDDSSVGQDRVLAQIEKRILESAEASGTEAKGDEPPIGAIIIEPIQGRGGTRVPAPGFLTQLRELCTRTGTILIFDEIYTGLGRTGDFWACCPEDNASERVIPDLILAGKALGGGLPLSVCMGRAEIIDKWAAGAVTGLSAEAVHGTAKEGEARHTSTFMGHPLACAAALAVLDIIEDENLVARAREKGERLMNLLSERLADSPGAAGSSIVAEIRGRGLMIGIEMRGAKGNPASEIAWGVVVEALRRGLILLASGPSGNIISLTPPLTISDAQIDFAAEIIAEIIDEIVRR